MSPELTQNLFERYPLLFKNRHQGVHRSLMGFGFAHDDGWYNLLNVLFGLIYADYEQAKSRYAYLREHEGQAPYKGADVVSAVEVERARLKMANAEAALPQAVQVKEKFGTLRVYMDGCNEAVSAYITFAEALSGSTCEKCGAPGRRQGRGWIRTLCDTHAKTQASDD